MAKRKLKSEDEVRLFLIGHGDFNYSAKRKKTNPVTFALYYVMEQITLRNMELIERIVYENYDPLVYERTNQFEYAWKFNISTMGNNIHGKFEYAPKKMQYNASKGQHGTPDRSLTGYMTDEYYQDVASSWGDARDDLAAIIYENLNGSLFPNTGWKHKRDAWSPLIKSLESQRLGQWFQQGLRQAGLKCRRK